MKRFNLFLILLALVQVAWAQKNQYTERLDSIVTNLQYGIPAKFVFRYNEEGLLVEQQIDGRIHGKWEDRGKHLYDYDEQGRLTTMIVYSRREDVPVSRQLTEYDDKGRISTWTYELYDKKRGVWGVPTEGEKRKYAYDARGNLICETLGYVPIGMDQFMECQKSEMEYDKEGRLITQRDYEISYQKLYDELKLHNTHHYIYDKQGRVISVVRDGTVTDNSGTEHYTYDKHGRLKSFLMDRGGIPQREEHYYDPHGNLIQIATFLLFDDEWGHVCTQTFTYDLDTPVSSVMGLTCPEVLSTDQFLKKKLNLTRKPLSVSVDYVDGTHYNDREEAIYYYSYIDTPTSLETNTHLSQQDSVKHYPIKTEKIVSQ